MDCNSASEIPDLLENLWKSSASSLEPLGNKTRERYYKLETTKKSTSNSLILKETTETSFKREQTPSAQLLFQAYHISDPKSSHRNILCKSPKQPQKKLKKRTQATKKIHNTVSNLENSLYLVVSREKSDKVYEIKTSVTGSATLLKIKPDSYSIKSKENVTYDRLKSNEILESVRMEQKKQEEMLKDEEGESQDKFRVGNQFTSNKKMGMQFGKETTVCHCPVVTKSEKIAKNFRSNVETNKSRVKITGRLGLTEDDKYVLNCAATIDDQPIETHYAAMKGSDSPINIFFNQHPSTTSAACKKYTCKDIMGSRTLDVHAEGRADLKNKHEATYNICRKGSASTQVNLNLFFADEKTEHKDETVQCSCGYTKDISTFTEIEEMAQSEGKNNPLVVISVFKKHRGQDQSDFDIKVGEAGDVTIVDNKPRTSELPRTPTRTETSPENIEVNPYINTRRIDDKNIRAKSTTIARNASPSFRSPITPRTANTNQNDRKDTKASTASPPPRHIPRQRNDTSLQRNRAFFKENEILSKDTKGSDSSPSPRYNPRPRNDSSPERDRAFVKENETLSKDAKGSASSSSPRYVPKTRNDSSPERNRAFVKENETILKDAKGSASSPSPRYVPRTRNDASPEQNKVVIKENETPLKREANNLKSQKLAIDSLPERSKIATKTDHKLERNKVVPRTDLSPERNKFATRKDVSPERNILARANTKITPMKTKEIGRNFSPYVPFSGKQKPLVTERNKPKLTIETDKTLLLRRNVVKEEKTDKVKSTYTENKASKAKKSLVDTFTRKITENITPKKTKIPEAFEERTHSGAESTGSRVTVNIDAENEYYDLLFHQDSDTTDLSIRKRRKLRSSPKQSLEYYDENLSASLENFLVSAEDNERKRSISQTWNNDHNFAITPSANNSTPPLKVIDSIELSHRREERSNTNHSLKLPETNLENIAENREDSCKAPAKHYRGDKCLIIDPMQRDMEIRELLGVQKRRRSLINTVKSKVETVSKLAHKDTLHIYCPEQKRKINVMVILNQNPDVLTMVEKTEYLNRGTNCVELKSVTTQYEYVMNTNRQIQFENFRKSKKDLARKSKSISLCKVDYYKVRKLITRSLTQKKKYRICKRVSVFLLGEVRRKGKKKKVCRNKSIQTDYFEKGEKKLERKDQIKQIRPKQQNTTVNIEDEMKKIQKGTNIIGRKESTKTIVLFDAKKAKLSKQKDKLQKPGFPSQVWSAVEIRYAQVSYKLSSAFNKNKSLNYRDSVLHVHEHEELFTSKIKERRRRPVTPNLGVSGLSLCGEYGSVSSVKKPPVCQQRKPLLRRLVSRSLCFMLRAPKMTKLQKERSMPRMATSESSVDWYRVTSSCAPFDMTSSIYDTTASFYTDHAVEPIPIKSRRGFLLSMWNVLKS